MEICTMGTRARIGVNRSQSPPPVLALRLALKQWITPLELESLSAALARGCPPPDLLGKLRALAAGGLSHRFIEQHCRLFIGLLLAAEHDSFRECAPAERERLLRVLAYVRKDRDAIPDDQTDGFTDDQREVYAASVDLVGLLQAFKVWRLRFQVPVMWHEKVAA